MYLHIGNNRNIREKSIIGIFDTDTATVSVVSRKFLTTAEKSGRLESSTEEIPKSFIVFEDKGDFKVCFSQLSTAVLLGRSGNEQN